MSYTKKQYNQLLETMSEDDWKDIKKKLEKKLPEIRGWEEELFRTYASSVVRSGFRREGLN